MTPEIYIDDSDDGPFIHLVRNAVTNLVNEVAPDEFFVVRIKNWFDHKWLKFSGKAVIPFPERVTNPPVGGLGIDSAWEERSREKVTFPPFNPNRILRQQYFRSEGTKRKHLIHRSYRERTAYNLQRRVTQYSQRGVFVWFSSNTYTNGRGSIMVYTVIDELVSTWYASLIRNGGWNLGRVKGVSKQVVEKYLNERRRYTQQKPRA